MILKASSSSLGVVLVSAILFTSAIDALHCYQCLQLSCESHQLCHSIQLSMSHVFFPRRNHLEFNPNVTCPVVPYANVSTWSRYSGECRKSDSVCLQARIEVLTSFSGLRNSLALDRFSDTWSKGYLRACASRRFFLGLSDPTLEVKDEKANDTLTFDLEPKLAKANLTLTEIFFHHFYVDHGTVESIKCLQDNCNAVNPPSMSKAAYQLNCDIYLEFIFALILLSCSSIKFNL